MTIWEIVNISDPYTMICDDFEVATVACILLGEGEYGLREVNGERKVPIMLFGADWIENEFRCSAQDLMIRVGTEKREELAHALDSILIGTPGERVSFSMPMDIIEDQDKRHKWSEDWHDQHRSSLNDIGRHAWAIAKHIRSTKPETMASEG